MTARLKPLDLRDHGPLTRADGVAAYNGYFWSQNEGDHYQLHGRHADGGALLWVVPLNDGRWLAQPPGSFLQGPYFATREAALRTAVARVLVNFRRRHRAGKDAPMFYKIGDIAFAHVTAWLFTILIDNFGRRRTWRWRRVCAKALEARARTSHASDYLQLCISHEARRYAGEPPRRGKSAWAKWEAAHAFVVAAMNDERASEIRDAMTAVSLAQLRIERLAAARPWGPGAPFLRKETGPKIILADAVPRLDLRVWLTEVDRQTEKMRASTPHHQRLEKHARTLTVAEIRASRDEVAINEVQHRLRRARYPDIHMWGLDRVWSRADLGLLIVEATNRSRQLRAGDRQRAKGPTLDPRYIPDDRLDWLIQRHRDLVVVEALRAERWRRTEAAA